MSTRQLVQGGCNSQRRARSSGPGLWLRRSPPAPNYCLRREAYQDACAAGKPLNMGEVNALAKLASLRPLPACARTDWGAAKAAVRAGCDGRNFAALLAAVNTDEAGHFTAACVDFLTCALRRGGAQRAGVGGGAQHSVSWAAHHAAAAAGALARWRLPRLIPHVGACLSNRTASQPWAWTARR